MCTFVPNFLNAYLDVPCALHTCMWVFVCVWPFKRFLQGREGREDNGSRHYLLLSCWLSIRPHTMWPSQTWMPSGCTCTHSPSQRMHVPNTLTHAHTHTWLCRDDLHACRASYVDTLDTEKEITHLRVLTPTLNEHSFLLAKREHIPRQDWQVLHIPDQLFSKAEDWWIA